MTTLILTSLAVSLTLAHLLFRLDERAMARARTVKRNQ